LFHTHSAGATLGGSGWDAWIAVKDLDPRYIGINFDIGHVTAKGGFGWSDCVRTAHTHIGSLSVKDCHWVKSANPVPGKWPWSHEFVVPGTGMVNFHDFLAYFKSIDFTGPIEVYYEYMAQIPGTTATMNMLGTDFRKWKLEVPEDYFLSLMKRDVDFYRNQLATVGFSRV
jgi:sugar phosphate isomerase/epimerase